VEILEQMPQVLVTLLEKTLQHREIQRLAKPPRTREQNHVDVIAINQLGDEIRLVDVLVPMLAKLSEVAGTDGDAQGHDSLVGKCLARASHPFATRSSLARMVLTAYEQVPTTFMELTWLQRGCFF
jgi:hypothetical protein